MRKYVCREKKFPSELRPFPSKLPFVMHISFYQVSKSRGGSFSGQIWSNFNNNASKSIDTTKCYHRSFDINELSMLKAVTLRTESLACRGHLHELICLQIQNNDLNGNISITFTKNITQSNNRLNRNDSTTLTNTCMQSKQLSQQKHQYHNIITYYDVCRASAWFMCFQSTNRFSCLASKLLFALPYV